MNQNPGLLALLVTRGVDLTAAKGRTVAAVYRESPTGYKPGHPGPQPEPYC